MSGKIDKLFFIISSLLKPTFLPYWLATLIILIGGFVMARMLFRKQRFTSSQAFFFALTLSYYFLVFSYTVLTRSSHRHWLIELKPFWSYRDVIIEHSGTQLFWILVNLAMLSPIGFLLPLWKKNLNWKRVLVTAAVLSYVIEFSQLLLHRGNFELFDDPINNIAGCLIGYAIGKTVQKKWENSKE